MSIGFDKLSQIFLHLSGSPSFGGQADLPIALHQKRWKQEQRRSLFSLQENNNNHVSFGGGNDDFYDNDNGDDGGLEKPMLSFLREDFPAYIFIAAQ